MAMELKKDESIVYMTKSITPEGLTAVYNALVRDRPWKTPPFIQGKIRSASA